ncbi:hypothetical protein SRABI128_05825 [Microbacterium sp. Bi128]|nr:hypothetical protein SRABI128_05825 [Microbacterium sp. Bi128]
MRGRWKAPFDRITLSAVKRPPPLSTLKWLPSLAIRVASVPSRTGAAIRRGVGGQHGCFLAA